jgi:hypothetical protein
MFNQRFYAPLLLTLALTLPLGAKAAGPIIEKISLDDTFTTGFCGFPMEVHSTGSAVFHIFLDEAGNFSRGIITAPQTRITFTNLITGESVWTPSVNMVQETDNQDGTGTKTLRGLFWHLIIPGEGLITADVGKLDILITLDSDGVPISEEVVFTSGQQDGAFIPMLCDALG